MHTPDTIIHIRTYPDAPVSASAFCGTTHGRTLTGAHGYYGPGGLGHDDVCPECERAWKDGKCRPPSGDCR